MSSVPPEAVQVIKTFLEASDRKDVETMKGCLDRQSVASGNFSGVGPDGVRFDIVDSKMEGEQPVVTVRGTPIDAPADGPPAMELACLLVQEDGQWKFNLMGTIERMMGGTLELAMQQMAEGMGKVMEGVGQALSEAMGAPTSEKKDEIDPSVN